MLALSLTVLPMGAIFPGRDKVEHMPNEHLIIDDMLKAMNVYANAIYQLQGVEL